MAPVAAVPERLSVLVFCFLGNVLCYVDRTNISVAIIPMAQRYEWTKAEQGYVLSAFFVGYLFTQVVGGWLASRHGGGPVLLVAVVVWSLFTLVTPLAAADSFALLLLARVGMGLGEGMALPAIHGIACRWFPAGERTRSIALIGSGHSVGILCALACAPIIATNWESVFYGFGGLGLVWALAFHAWSPTQRPYPLGNLSDDETVSVEDGPQMDMLNATAMASGGNTGGLSLLPVKGLLTHPACWAVYGSHFTMAWAWYILISWLPKYLVLQGVATAGVGLYAAVPYVVQVLVANFSGWLADRLTNAGVGRTKVRKLMQLLAHILPSVFLLLVVAVRSGPVVLSALMAGALGLTGFGVAGYSANIIDIAPRHAAQVFGISNTLATVSGILGNVATGWLWQASNSFDTVFLLCVALHLGGALCFLRLATGEVVFP